MRQLASTSVLTRLSGNKLITLEIVAEDLTLAKKRSTHVSVLSVHFFTPFLPYISLISVFGPTDGAAKIFTMVPLFLPPMTSIHAGARDNRLCVRESARGGDTQEDRSTKIFRHIQV